MLFWSATISKWELEISATQDMVLRLSPFVLGGAGWYYTDVDGPTDNDTDHRFGLHAGGGVELMLNERWSADGTYRYVWVEDVKAQNTSLTNKDFQDDGHMVTIGINLHF